ncbi:transposase family protein [Streptomyces sp. NPDC001852]|uniref:transposase family protein n=1 Tax=Streptomyces sp. NPDC001852 TaxID=3364619 RepID=UPI0036C700AC
MGLRRPPGRTHDATAARSDRIVEHLQAAGRCAFADLGSIGVDKPESPDDLVIVTGYKATRARKVGAGQQRANRVLAAGSASAEHGFANLKAWSILNKLRTDPAHATALLRALLVLTILEVNR